MDEDETISQNEVSVIDRARATIARTETSPKAYDGGSRRNTSPRFDGTTEMEEEEEVILYENRVPDKCFCHNVENCVEL